MHPKTRLALVLATMLVGACALPASAAAIEMRSAASVVVAPGEVVADDLYAFGNTVTIEGTVDGDLVAFAQIVVVNGEVSGSVISAGQSIRIGGTVSGTVRAAGALLEVSGSVGGDVVAGAAEVNVAGAVARDVAAGAQNVAISGDVGRNVMVGSDTLTIAGSVGGDVQAESNRVRVTSDGEVAGDLNYWSTTEADIQGTVTGTTTRHEPPADGRQRQEQRAGGGFAGAILTAIWAWAQSFVGFALLGLLMVYALRGVSERASQASVARVWPSVGVGLLVFFATPIAAGIVFLFGLFIGAWWLAFVLLALYWLLLIAGMVVGGIAVGRAILRRARAAGEPALVWSMLLGLVLVWIVVVVPFIGWIAAWLVMLAGSGALVLLWLGKDQAPLAPAGSVPEPIGSTAYPPAPPMVPPPSAAPPPPMAPPTPPAE